METTHLPDKGKIVIERIVFTHGREPYILADYIKSYDNIRTWNGLKRLDYIIAMIPLDVIDDVNYSDRYNPRRLKPNHRDLLMEQMGTYGLIYPLVATMESSNGISHLYLIDGRHRYNGLLQLDIQLKNDIYKLAEEKENNFKSFTAYHNIPDPKNSSISAIEKYTPDSEHHDDLPPYLIPVKIYLNTDEIETIGMAVFLNRGQKKLSGGEQIEKIAKAFEIALNKSQNEINAATQIDPTDPGKIVASWIVAQIMNDNTTPWFELIGRWQGERLEETENLKFKPLTANNSLIFIRTENLKFKPLTANNFLIFIRTLINETPNNSDVSYQRDMEIQNLVRLGNIFSKVFDWPRDIPVSSTNEGDLKFRYTSTSILCRSFVIQALGTVLNKMNRRKEDEKILSSNLNQEVWERLVDQIVRVKKEFVRQANLKVEFESLKKQVKDTKYNDPARRDLIRKLDELRGKLWTLDTVTSTLTIGIEKAIEHQAETQGSTHAV